jgi:hypothetical protein
VFVSREGVYRMLVFLHAFGGELSALTEAWPYASAPLLLAATVVVAKRAVKRVAKRAAKRAAPLACAPGVRCAAAAAMATAVAVK